jgi:hypothetical protein
VVRRRAHRSADARGGVAAGVRRRSVSDGRAFVATRDLEAAAASDIRRSREAPGRRRSRASGR